MWDIKLGRLLGGEIILSRYYLNHVGYKESKAKDKESKEKQYYLNHVGYKDVQPKANLKLSNSQVLSEPCGI